MRLVYIYPKLTFASGTERILINKMNFFANQEGYEVMALTYEQDNHPIVFPLSSKVINVDLDARFYELYKYNRFVRLIKWTCSLWRLRKRFDDLMASFRHDIVIATTYYADIMSMVKSCPVPFVKLLESHIDQRYIHNNRQKQFSLFQRLHSWIKFRTIVRMSSKFDRLVALNSDDALDWSSQLSTVVIENMVHLNPLGRISSQDTKPEAMSCGLPMVAFDCPSGPANIVNNGVDGYLIKSRDINAFDDKVCYLINHQDIRLKMGKAAVQSSLRYSPEVVIPKWKEFFITLLSEKLNNLIEVGYERCCFKDLSMLP